MLRRAVLEDLLQGRKHYAEKPSMVLTRGRQNDYDKSRLVTIIKSKVLTIDGNKKALPVGCRDPTQKEHGTTENPS